MPAGLWDARQRGAGRMPPPVEAPVYVGRPNDGDGDAAADGCHVLTQPASW